MELFTLAMTISALKATATDAFSLGKFLVDLTKPVEAPADNARGYDPYELEARDVALFEELVTMAIVGEARRGRPSFLIDREDLEEVYHVRQEPLLRERLSVLRDEGMLNFDTTGQGVESVRLDPSSLYRTFRDSEQARALRPALVAEIFSAPNEEIPINIHIDEFAKRHGWSSLLAIGLMESMEREGLVGTTPIGLGVISSVDPAFRRARRRGMALEMLP